MIVFEDEIVLNRRRDLLEGKKEKKQLKTTTNPFKLRTEERGKCNEENFRKKLQQMREEEEKIRVPIAQGLPWTTDKLEYPEKAPVKEATRPIYVVIHSDARAEEHAEFDHHQVVEKMSLIERYKTERERQQNLDEEEEIRRLRKELVPKAQLMPYFDRPFIPTQSKKQPTIPNESKIHVL